jgi:hypothetical protein
MRRKGLWRLRLSSARTRIAIDRETVQSIELVGHIDAKRLKAASRKIR